jgi:hypothetical protein
MKGQTSSSRQEKDTLDVKKEDIFKSQDQRILTQHEGLNKYFQNIGG